LIVSDSGGIQEEAPTLGKPLLVLRETTERPEAVEAGVARLGGGRPGGGGQMAVAGCHDRRWVEEVAKNDRPFGKRDSGQRIVERLVHLLGASVKYQTAA